MRRPDRVPRALAAGVALLALAGLVAAVLAVLRAGPWRPPPPVAPPRWPVTVTTFAGGGAPGRAEGRGPGARFADPFGVALDAAGNVFVADGGENNLVWRITSGGEVTRVAGGAEGFLDGDAAVARFNTPSGLAFDAAGRLVVADTGNHAIRAIDPAGTVTTLAGNGTPGREDGTARAARFDGPIGVAVAPDGAIWVSDTYNDAIRRIAPDGAVTTVAGGSGAGWRDGPGREALFDTPTGIVVGPAGDVFVADTGNGTVRRIGPDGAVTTFGGPGAVAGRFGGRANLRAPVGLAMSGNDLYLTDGLDRVLVFAPEGLARTLAGGGAGFRNGSGAAARFNGLAGIAVDGRGVAYVADNDNYLVRRLTPPGLQAPPADIDLGPVPWLTARTSGLAPLRWPLAPQDAWHEVAATLGEARGSAGGDGRERLHSGIDVRGDVGEVARAVADEKVRQPIPAWAWDSLNESLRVGLVSYVHIRVGRTAGGVLLDPARFSMVRDEWGTPLRVRVRRGTRFRAGDALGTLNRFAHVHLEVGPRGAEINPLALGLPGFEDTIAPTILPRGIELYDESGTRLAARVKGRLVASGRVSVVVEAYDRVNGNARRRRLGVYAAGYQVLDGKGRPIAQAGLAGAGSPSAPRMTIRFDRLPSAPDAPWITYADGSGITVYGNRVTRFRYIVTHVVAGGDAAGGYWDTGELAPGDYVLRALVADRAGNTTHRDLPITIVR